MIRWIPAPVVGVSSLLAAVAIFSILFFPLYLPAAFIKWLIPEGKMARALGRWCMSVQGWWMDGNTFYLTRILGVRLDLRMPAGLDRAGSYLMTVNHRSWVDIPVLLSAMRRRVAGLRLFAKVELKWIPFVHMCCVGADYPFIRRYSREEIKKKPELAGRDLETVRETVTKLANEPSVFLFFSEGTRFTQAKREAQQKVYRHLLKPRAGGLALAVAAAGERFRSLLDVTLVYPESGHSLWDFLCGRLRRIVVHAVERPIPRDLLTGDYRGSVAARKRFQLWVQEFWQEKDETYEAILGELAADAEG